jgi:glutamate 5-kinase
MSRPILILKFGSAALTRPDGTLHRRVMLEIARQTAQLCADWRVAIVSSGAVAAGKSHFRAFGGSVTERKAAAAVGNPLLLQQYAQYFAAYDLPVAQSLCERRHFADRRLFLQLQDTFECLWANGMVPIVNENDVVSDRELRFSDNDELATLLAVGFGAERLLLCTAVGGLLDAQGQWVRQVKHLDESIFALVRPEKSSVGLGGMASKLTFAKLAVRFGIRTHIFGMEPPDAIQRTLRGEVGTDFLPKKSSESARRRWLASGSLAAGRVHIDAGAVAALQRRSSLLAVGVRKVTGQFAAGEVVEIVGEHALPIAVARLRIGSEQLAAQLQTQNLEVAHANDIVLLDEG